MSRQARLRLFAVALAVATLAAYTGLRSAEFVTYDTPDYVLENPQVRAGLSADGLAWAFSNTEQANWHPLTWLSHMLDVQLFGLDAPRHKRVSLAIHLAASLVLLFALASWTGAPGRSAFVAGAFALHPVHIESVAWVAERKDVLSALFFFASLAAYVGWVRTGGAARYALSLVLFAAGLASKPMVVTLPCVLLLLDYWPLERSLSDWRRLVAEKLPFFALAAVISAITFVAQRDEGAIGSLSLGVRVASAAVAYVAYLWKAVWPVDLAVLYPHLGAPPWWQPLAAVLLLAGITRLVLYESARRRYLAVGWFWYLGTLVPVIGLVQVGSQWIADRYTYLPFVGLSIMAAWGVPDLLASRPARLRKMLPVLAVALLAAWTLGTRAQLRYWADTYTLFSRALELTERNWVAHGLVGVELYSRGDLTGAIGHLERSVELRPEQMRARANLGAALLEAGRLEPAAQHLREAQRLDPEDLDTRFQLARLAELRGHLEHALAGYAAILKSDPAYAPALRRTGLVHYRRRELALAERWLDRATRAEPESAAGHAFLGRVLEARGRTHAARQRYQRALELRPGYPLATERLRALGGEAPR